MTFTASPEEVGFSSKRLERLSQTMQSHTEESHCAGMVVLLARHNRICYFESFGVMDIEAGKPMQPNVIFRIYSMSKPITSVAVMKLYEQNCFHLNTPVSEFIPAFGDLEVVKFVTDSGIELESLHRQITIHDLLTHTSGLSYGFETDSPVEDLYRNQLHDEAYYERSLEEMIALLVTFPLVNQPGSAWRYSVATDVLGYLVEVVSGVPFGDYLQTEIFDPLEMKDTGFYVPEGRLNRLAANYTPDPDGGLVLFDAPSGSTFARPPRLHSGGGGLVSTTTDYLHFAQMLLNSGEWDGRRILGRKTVELMTQNHLPENMHPFENPGVGFGLGVRVVESIGRNQILGSKGEYGWGGAASTNFWVDPQEDLIGIVMPQLMNNAQYPFGDDLRVLAYQALVG